MIIGRLSAATRRVCWTFFWLSALAWGGEPSFNDGKIAYDRGSYRLAEDIWKPLAAEGDVEAQFYLGLMYQLGPGAVVADDTQAAYWFRRAAEQGQINSQIYLGEAYFYGRGAPQNAGLAKYWWQRAAATGSPGAIERLNWLRDDVKAVAEPPSFDLPTAASIGRVVDQPSASETAFVKVKAEPADPAVTGGEPVVADDGRDQSRKSDVGRDEDQGVAQISVTTGEFADSINRDMRWFASQNPGHYTLQLAAANSARGFQDFVDAHQFEDRAYVVFLGEGRKTPYLLLVGSYPTLGAAQDVARSLKSQLRGDRPWPRKIGDLQQQLR